MNSEWSAGFNNADIGVALPVKVNLKFLKGLFIFLLLVNYY